MFDWLPDTALGHLIITFLISLAPLLESRASIPYGMVWGIPWYIVFPVSIIGNFIPVPFIIVFIKKIFAWFKAHTKLGKWIEKIEARAIKKSAKVLKYRTWGMFIFCALPIPGTGAWMGSLIAALLNMRLKQALPSILGGVFVCAVIITLAAYGVIGGFEWFLKTPA
jgi:uncharacterized membrane protein